MVRLEPKLAKIKAYGTDGKKCVYEALRSCFGEGIHLLCWIHVKDNIKKKLSELGCKNKSEYIREIFGKVSGDVKVKGLLDAKSDEEFENEFARLEKRWQERGAVGVQFRRYAVTLLVCFTRTSRPVLY